MKSLFLALIVIPFLLVHLASAELSHMEFLAPLQQIQNGISSESIKCNDNKSLIYKYNNFPACINIGTIEKLIQRGWTTTQEPLAFQYEVKDPKNLFITFPQSSIGIFHTNGIENFTLQSPDNKITWINISEKPVHLEIGKIPEWEHGFQVFKIINNQTTVFEEPGNYEYFIGWDQKNRYYGNFTVR